MIIRGILDSSLNGQLCIRGFALIKELARISKADYDYQRIPLAEQEETIREFLDYEEYLFFPEVILSYKIKHSFDKIANSQAPLQKLNSTKKYNSPVDNTSIKIKEVDYKAVNDSRGVSIMKVVEMELDNSILSEAVEKGNHPFHRIDGNHRLRAAELTTTTKVDKMVAPFCIILGEEFYENNILQENKTTDLFNKSVKIFFHNINTKTVPLTSEENLKVIIDDKRNFQNDELEQILGEYAVKTRELIDKVNPEIFTGIEHILSKRYRTYYNDIFRRLLQKGEHSEGVVDKVLESLKVIDILYKENDSLKANSSFGLLTVFLYYHVEGNKGKFDLFQKWVINNHIFEIQESKAESIIRIFDKIYQRTHVSVFVAMPYWSHAKVTEYNKMFTEVLKEVQGNAKSNLDLELIPIMRFRGESQRIDQRLLTCIRDCGIFIADITECNENVMYEVAFAEGCNKPMILVKKEGDEANPPFDMEKMQWIPYDVESYYNSIKGIIKNNITAILEDKFGIHFKFNK